MHTTWPAEVCREWAQGLVERMGRLELCVGVLDDNLSKRQKYSLNHRASPTQWGDTSANANNAQPSDAQLGLSFVKVEFQREKES